MNFVVLTAALSSMNTNLYLTGRMLFSLSRSGYAPKAFGKLTEKGSPRNAVLISTIGLFAAAFITYFYPDSAYMSLFGISIFGGITVWIIILVTLIFFRKKRLAAGHPVGKLHMPLYPWLAVIGIIALVAILFSCFSLGLAIAWEAGVPWLIFISICYFITKSRKKDA
jgi:L-asparagine transporter-like permease